MIALPEDVKPGEEFSWRLGPPNHYNVDVPEGAKPGEMVEFMGQNGESLHASIPQGLKVGDKFQVSPPVVMVQVPQGAKPGQELIYTSPFQESLITHVPEGLTAGQYFAALFGIPKPLTETEAPQDGEPPEAKEPTDPLDGVNAFEEPTEEDQLVVE